MAAGAILLLQEQWCGYRGQDLVAGYFELSFKVVFLHFCCDLILYWPIMLCKVVSQRFGLFTKCLINPKIPLQSHLGDGDEGGAGASGREVSLIIRPDSSLIRKGSVLAIFGPDTRH